MPLNPVGFDRECRQTGLDLPWEIFLEYWDDFCYPSSDDAFVVCEASAAILAWEHEELFKFIVDGA